MKRIVDEERLVPEDDTVVMRLYLRWVDEVAIVTQAALGTPPIGCLVKNADGLCLAFSLDRSATRRQRHFVNVAPAKANSINSVAWSLVCLAPGVWDLPQSVHVPGQFHGFVTLLGVPILSPWQRDEIV